MTLQEMIQAKADEAVAFVMANREKFIKAWIAEHGCWPSECVLEERVEQQTSLMELKDPTTDGDAVGYLVFQAMQSTPNGREVSLIEKCAEYLRSLKVSTSTSFGIKITTMRITARPQEDIVREERIRICREIAEYAKRLEVSDDYSQVFEGLYKAGTMIAKNDFT